MLSIPMMMVLMASPAYGSLSNIVVLSKTFHVQGQAIPPSSWGLPTETYDTYGAVSPLTGEIRIDGPGYWNPCISTAAITEGGPADFTLEIYVLSTEGYYMDENYEEVYECGSAEAIATADVSFRPLTHTCIRDVSSASMDKMSLFSGVKCA